MDEELALFFEKAFSFQQLGSAVACSSDGDISAKKTSFPQATAEKLSSSKKEPTFLNAQVVPSYGCPSYCIFSSLLPSTLHPHQVTPLISTQLPSPSCFLQASPAPSSLHYHDTPSLMPPPADPSPTALSSSSSSSSFSAAPPSSPHTTPSPSPELNAFEQITQWPSPALATTLPPRTPRGSCRDSQRLRVHETLFSSASTSTWTCVWPPSHPLQSAHATEGAPTLSTLVDLGDIDGEVFDDVDVDAHVQWSRAGEEDEGRRHVVAATRVGLMVLLTTTLDYAFLAEFFLVYRYFFKVEEFIKLLELRYKWAYSNFTSDHHALVRFRLFVVLRHWITEYFALDFLPYPTTHRWLRTFLETLMHWTPPLMARDQRLVATLLQVYLETWSHTHPWQPPPKGVGYAEWLAHERFYEVFQHVYQAFSQPTLASAPATGTSFLNVFPLTAIANHFYLIESMLLHAVPWTALVDQSHASVQAWIDRFNLGCQWVPAEICSQTNISERVKIIEKLIKLAQQCYRMRNYATLTQLTLGLQHKSVERLTKTWSKVSQRHQKTLRRLLRLTSPLKNFSLLRKAMQDHQGIPFLGMYLSDLVFTQESFSSHPHMDNDASKHAQPKSEWIAYHKYHVMANVINEVRQFQAHPPVFHGGAPELSVYACCLCLDTVSEEVLSKWSLECEKKKE